MKHCYLIIAHQNLEQLKILLQLLDYPENSIYLHLDRKCREMNPDDFKKTVHLATLFVYQKYKVWWGDISLTKCMFFLLQEALRTPYDYYHLLSGADLPIKPHQEILDFFATNRGKQFVHFESDSYCGKESCRYYHFLYSAITHCQIEWIKKVLLAVEHIFLIFQKKLGVRRQFYCGSQWFSITRELAEDFSRAKHSLLRKVRWTIASDELVLQTFLRTSMKRYMFYAPTHRPEDYVPLAREIDWGRGRPYVWRAEDFAYLSQSSSMYARKFDQGIDKEIIDMIRNNVFKGSEAN